jgi:hypothetical protein
MIKSTVVTCCNGYSSCQQFLHNMLKDVMYSQRTRVGCVLDNINCFEAFILSVLLCICRLFVEASQLAHILNLLITSQLVN